MTKQKTIRRSLPVKLTAEKLRDISKEISAASVEEERIENELKERGAELRKSLHGTRKTRRDLARMHNAGEEMMPVECSVDADLKMRTVIVTRLDTGEIV
jgi:hypothetical protein